MAISAASVARSLSRLEPHARDALALLALAPEQTAASWQELTRTAGVVDAAGRPLHGQPFRDAFDALAAERALLTGGPESTTASRGAQSATTRFVIQDAWLAAVLEDARVRGRIADLARAVPLDARARVRAALAHADRGALEEAVRRYEEAQARSGDHASLVGAVGLCPPAAWLELIHEDVRGRYVGQALAWAFEHASHVSEALLAAARGSRSAELRARAALVLALRDEGHAADEVLAEPGTPWELAAKGFIELTRARLDSARGYFARATAGPRGPVPLDSALPLFDWLSRLTADTYERSTLDDLEAKRERSQWPVAARALERLTELRTKGGGEPFTHAFAPGAGWVDVLVAGLAARWTDGSAPPPPGLSERLREQGYDFVTRELESLASERPLPPALVLAWTRRAPWERALRALEEAATTEHGDVGAVPVGELIWEVESGEGPGITLTARLIEGKARKGKAISVERLETDATLPLDTRDRLIVLAMAAAKARRIPLPASTLVHLVGDQRVRDPQGATLHVTERSARVRVQHGPEGFRVTLTPTAFDSSGIAVLREGDTLVLVRRTELATRIANVLGSDLEIPIDGMDRLGRVLASLAGSIEIEAPEMMTAGRDEEPDARIRVQLARFGEGLRVDLRIAPAGPKGPRVRPGEPPEVVVYAGPSGLARVRRDLPAERTAQTALLGHCPILASLPRDGEGRLARDLATALEVLLELDAARATTGSDLLVEWREGSPVLRSPRLAGANDLRLRVRGDTKWLEVDGEIRVDEDRVVSLRALLDAVATSEGRFVALGDAGFVALTDEVRAKLDALSRAQSVASKGKLGAALLPAVESWTSGLEVEWSGKLAKHRQDVEVDVDLPDTLRADLRDYQREGFQFLVRRTQGGSGAILADDMGLGKTVQAIALLLQRASQGPALVIMPTSVQSNWQDELRKFAPSLTLKAPDAELGPGDVVLVSYGMLVADETALAARTWTTLIFDEAHALKNPTTRRWAAARALNAEATILLTGTPVENHVGELHALFDVIAPGLLGSRAAFQRAFGIPIARGQREAAATLRQMVRPLLLRRTKSEVLGELPPKTEMLRTIVPSPEERAFYEAVRRRAQERLAALRSRGQGKGQAHIEILSEIMRLRRAAIDPRLVGGPEAPPGGKLAMLVRLVLDLRDEGHRALVFSQFLEVLDLAKEALSREGVVCRRLDGSLNAAERAAEVQAFQSGSGDVFLLSLRAGGVGMNLTGADYVVHLDPWWNPAVEDQATDRAHRIGQERPVTVVRMVTEGTIEEKVLALHGEKRRLYADLVGEADGKGSLDFEQLASLLS